MNNKPLRYINKSLKSHLKINWKLIISFAILWLLLSVIVTQMFSIGGRSGLYIAPNLTTVESSNTYDNGGYGKSLSYVWGAFGFIFFSVISLVLVFNTYIKEMKIGQITLWMTSGLSKGNVFLSKLVLIFIINILVFSPSFLVLIIISSTAKDSNLYIGHIIADGILFLLFNLFLAALYTFIGMLFVNQSSIFLVISIFLTLFIFATAILNLIYAMVTVNEANGAINSPIFSWMKYVKYFSIQSLYVSILQFSDIKKTSLLFDEKRITTTAEFYIKNKVWTSIAPLIVIGLSIVFSSAASFIFKNKDLKI